MRRFLEKISFSHFISLVLALKKKLKPKIYSSRVFQESKSIHDNQSAMNEPLSSNLELETRQTMPAPSIQRRCLLISQVCFRPIQTEKIFKFNENQNKKKKANRKSWNDLLNGTLKGMCDWVASVDITSDCQSKCPREFCNKNKSKGTMREGRTTIDCMSFWCFYF